MKTFILHSLGDETCDELCRENQGKPPRLTFETAIAMVAAENWEPNVGPVRLRGEPLSTPISWLGEQWAVTSHGIECRDGSYEIDRSRLLHIGHDWDWCTHLSSKSWVNIRDFAKAYEFALLKFRDMTLTDYRDYRRKLLFDELIG